MTEPKLPRICGGCGFVLPDDRICETMECGNDYSRDVDAFAALEIYELDMKCDKVCPFCGDDGFDFPGLKSHLMHADCGEFRHVQTITRTDWE